MIIDNFDPPSCVPSLGYVFSLEKIKYSMITDQKLAMAKSGNSRTPNYTGTFLRAQHLMRGGGTVG